MNDRYCRSCGQWPTHKPGCMNDPHIMRPESKGQGHRLIIQLKGRINELNEILEQRNKECSRNSQQIKGLNNDIVCLVRHAAVLGSDLAEFGENADWSTESFIGLPDHLQTAINDESERISKRGV